MTGATDPAAALPSARGRRVGVELAAHLERLIAVGEFVPGGRLPAERDLAGSMRVSRASVREALQHLEARSLVERVHGRGTVVLEPPPQVAELDDGLTETARELADVAELREVVEPRIAEFAARRSTAVDLRRLEDLLAASHEDLPGADSLRLDQDFHATLARASQNPLLIAVNALATTWTADVRRHSHATRRARRVSIEGHGAVLEAVRARDGSAAATAMTRHLTDVAALIRHATATGPGDRS